MESGFLHETKSILKSLVISCPKGITVDRLNRDYKDTVGEWIPFKKLGYQSLELFLKSIPDTLVLTGHGREAIVGFVSSDKTQHINEMISRQKNTTRDRKAAQRFQPSQTSRPIMARPTQNRVANGAASKINCTFNPSPIVMNGFVPFYQPIPALFLRHLQQTFQPTIKNNTSQTQYFKQTQPAKANFNSKKTETPAKKNNPNLVLNEMDDNKKTPTNVSDNQAPIANGNEINKNGSFIHQNSNNKMLSEPRNTKSVLVDIQNSNKIIPSNENQQLNTEIRKDSHENSKEKTKLKVDNQIVYPSKNNVKEKLASENQKTTTYNKSHKIVENPVQEKKNTFVTNATNKSTDSIMFPTVPKKFSTKKKLAERLIKHPGLETVAEFEALTNHPKKPVDLKVVKSPIDVDNANRSRYFTDPFAAMDSSDNDIDEAVPEFAADFRVFHVDFPENTVPFGKKIPSVQFPKEFIKGAIVGVFISEIHSPFKFWFHPHKENHELDVLMNGIECFYERLGDTDLLIPRSCLTPGQVCVALYNDMWHRAEILSSVVANKIKVLFVDYGTVSDVEIQHIKYLQNRFADTPVQAIRGSLSHIKPVSQIWEKRAIKEFLGLVAEIFLYAQIIEIDEKDATVYMVLCDTNSGTTVQINKLLVERGFAKLDSEWDEQKIKENGYRKRHPRDIFPTFEMLETGEYPSLYEIEQLLAKGIDYEKITEKIIVSNLNSSTVSSNVNDDCSSYANKMSFNLLDTNPFKSDIISEIISLKMFDK